MENSVFPGRTASIKLENSAEANSPASRPTQIYDRYCDCIVESRFKHSEFALGDNAAGLFYNHRPCGNCRPFQTIEKSVDTGVKRGERK